MIRVLRKIVATTIAVGCLFTMATAFAACDAPEIYYKPSISEGSNVKISSGNNNNSSAQKTEDSGNKPGGITTPLIPFN